MTMLQRSKSKIAPISWQRILEDPRLLLLVSTTLNKVILIITDGLTKELCIGAYLFAKQIYSLGKKSGWLFVALYLKQCSACLMQWYAREVPILPTELSVPLSLTRTGLPRIIPSFHRAKIRKRDDTADILVKFCRSSLWLRLFVLPSEFRQIF